METQLPDRPTMSFWALWAVRIVSVSFGLLFGAYWMIAAMGTASKFGAVTDGAIRRALALGVSGQLLMAGGFLALYVSVAIGFPGWASRGRLLTRQTRMPEGREGRRRVERQINGTEPYRLDEVPYLRRLAADRVAMRRRSRATWLGINGLISVFAGYVIAQPEISTDPAALGVQVFRIIVGLMLLVTVAVAVVLWRARNDVRANAFLQRTQYVPGPAVQGR